jgi:hypothetical protein
MSDQPSSSKSTLPIQQQKISLLKPTDTASASSGDGSPEESQFPEPPPSGGQQPGEDLDRAQPSTSNS